MADQAWLVTVSKTMFHVAALGAIGDLAAIQAHPSMQ